MANFSEEATLKVVDQSSAQLKAINTALKNLQKTAASLKDATMNIKVNTSGLVTAVSAVEKLYKGVNNFKKLPPMLVTANTSGLTQAVAQIRAVRQAAARQVVMNVQPPALPRGAGGPPQVPPRGYGYGGRRGWAGAAAQGLSSGFGLGIPLGAGPPGLMALEIAAYAAAAALKQVGEAAASRDRTILQSAVQLTKAQRARFTELDDQRKAAERADPSTRPPLPMSDDVRSRLRTSLISDVSGTTQTERADNAEVLTKYLEGTVYARAFAADPTKTPEQAAEALRQLVQATNNATGSMVENGNISADAKRVFAGIQAAQVADPDLKPHLIKSTLANLKSAGFSLSPEAITTTLLTASNQGQRAGNDVFTAIKALSGNVDVKMLNNALAAMKDVKSGEPLLQGVERKEATKEQKKKGLPGNVIVSSGNAIDRELLQTNPAKWLDQYFKPILDQNVAAATQKAKVRRKGETDAGYAERVAGLDTEEGQQAIRVAEITKAFPGARASVINGVNQMMLNYRQFKTSLEQSADVIAEGNVPAALKASWSAQWDKLKQEVENRAASFGDNVAKSAGVADFLAKLSNAVADPTGKDAVELAKTAPTSIANLFNPLNISADLLKTAGSQLIEAAGQQSALGQAVNALAEKWVPGYKQKTPEEKAKAAKDAENQKVVSAAETAKRHTEQAIARAERQRDQAQNAVYAAKTAEDRAKHQDNANRYSAEIARLRGTLEVVSSQLQTAVAKANQKEPVAPTEVPDKDVSWVAVAFETIRQRAIAEAKKPPKKIATDWEGEDAAANNRKAAKEAAEEERRRAQRERGKKALPQDVPKDERNDPKWGGGKPSSVKEIQDAMDQSARSFEPVITGMNNGATAINTAGTSMGTAGSAMSTAASFMDAAAGRLNEAAGKLQSISVTINNNAGGGGPKAGETQPTNPN